MGPISVARSFDILIRLSHRYHISDPGRAHYYAEQALLSIPPPFATDGRLENALRTVWTSLHMPPEKLDFLDLIFSYGILDLKLQLDDLSSHISTQRGTSNDIQLSNLIRLGNAYGTLNSHNGPSESSIKIASHKVYN